MGLHEEPIIWLKLYYQPFHSHEIPHPIVLTDDIGEDWTKKEMVAEWQSKSKSNKFLALKESTMFDRWHFSNTEKPKILSFIPLDSELNGKKWLYSSVLSKCGYCSWSTSFLNMRESTNKKPSFHGIALKLVCMI